MSVNLDSKPLPKETELLDEIDIKTEVKSECEENVKLTDEDGKENSLLKIDEDDNFSFPPDNDVAEMMDNVHYNGLFPTVTDRYFTAYYKLNVQSPADDICILLHSNRICMLTLAPSHTVFQSNKEITNINFKVSQKLDRVMNKVSGKGKHGAQPLQANSNICIITSSSGETYTIKCCIIGKLVEVNEALLNNPKLLLEPPHKGGYLAIVLPNINQLDQMKTSLLTQTQYDLEMLEHRNSINHVEILMKNDSITTDNSPHLNPTEDQSTLPKKIKLSVNTDMKTANKV
ncbi:protein Abitram isoform X1 [Megalopta genalis]|uniref:protein Abitram isoform X1 n=1 Tax=Megalopta genalis TaxID=115081 RepID=UPI003FD6842E